MENHSKKSANNSYKNDMIALWKEHHAEHKSNFLYSSKRFDVLIMTLSAGGLYVVMETLRFIHEAHELSGTLASRDCYLKWAGILFVIAILINFFSQHWATTVFEHGQSIALGKIQEWHDQDPEIDLPKMEAKMAKLNSRNKCINITSAFMTVMGLFILILYYIVSV